MAPQPAVVPLRTPFELSRLTTRILFGTLMGGAGAGIILAGGWVFTAVICLVVYQASQEFYGFVTSKVIDLRTPWLQHACSCSCNFRFGKSAKVVDCTFAATPSCRGCNRVLEVTVSLEPVTMHNCSKAASTVNRSLQVNCWHAAL